LPFTPASMALAKKLICLDAGSRRRLYFVNISNSEDNAPCATLSLPSPRSRLTPGEGRQYVPSKQRR
jgi:hypothetical protein